MYPLDSGLLFQLSPCGVDRFLVVPDSALWGLPGFGHIGSLQGKSATCLVDNHDPYACAKVRVPLHRQKLTGRTGQRQGANPDKLLSMEGGRAPGATAATSAASRWQRWRSNLRLVSIRSFERERLLQAIGHVETEKRFRASQTPGSWTETAEAHLDQAKQHYEKGKIEAAWSSLKAAQRATITAFEETELALEARRVGREAEEKLRGWRKKAIEDALGLSPEPKEDHFPTRIRVAREILDEHQDNVYRRIRLLARQLTRAALALIAALVLLFVIVSMGWAANLGDGVTVLEDWRALATVMVLGAVGAVVSGVISLAASEVERRIPDLRTQLLLMSLRPLVGAGAAVLAVVVLRSGLGNAINVSDTGVYAVSLIAGFSERVATHAVEAASQSVIK